jgi:hypothetical protein
MQYELRYRFTGATLCRQGGKVDNVASAITVSRAYFSCNKRTRHETSIDFFFHVALASGRMQILDGASFRTSRVGPLWISVAVFAHAVALPSTIVRTRWNYQLCDQQEKKQIHIPAISAHGAIGVACYKVEPKNIDNEQGDTVYLFVPSTSLAPPFFISSQARP